MAVRVRVPLAALFFLPPMKHFLYIISMVMLLAACGVDGNHFKLSGRFLNMNQGEFYIYSPEGGVDGIDTIKVVGGRFTYERPCERPAMLVLVFPNFSEAPIFAQPGKSVEIKADASHMKEMEVKGTKANELMTRFRRQTASMSPPEIQKTAEEVINEHPDSPVGIFLLRRHFVQSVPPDYSKAVRLVTLMLEHQPKNGELIILKKQLTQLGHGLSGASLPRFSGPALEGGTVSDADLGDDIAVVCSWSSWSYDSQEMVRQLNRKARASGGRLKVLAVCLDADKKSCQHLVERDTLQIPILFDGQLFEGKAFQELGLTGIPDNIVFNRRKVVAHGLTTIELKSRLNQLLGK